MTSASANGSRVCMLALHTSIPCLLGNEDFGELVFALWAWAIVTCGHVRLSRQVANNMFISYLWPRLNSRRANQRIVRAKGLMLLTYHTFKICARCRDDRDEDVVTIAKLHLLAQDITYTLNTFHILRHWLCSRCFLVGDPTIQQILPNADGCLLRHGRCIQAFASFIFCRLALSI